MFKSKKLKATTGGVILLIVIILCINIIFSRFYVRADITEDGVYSLSKGSHKILKNLKNDISIKFYFSRNLKEVPVMIKTFASRVEELLYEYAAISDGKISVQIFNPKPDSDEEEWARKYGLKGTPLPSGVSFYFGAVFSMGSREAVIPFFDPRREEFIEYDISEAIVRVQRKEKIKIGIISSLQINGLNSPSPVRYNPEQESWYFVQQLQHNFDVQNIPLTDIKIADDIKVVIVVHPKHLSDNTLYALDQFVLRGGKLIVAVDPMSRVDLAANRKAQMMMRQAPQVSSDLHKLFTAWDIDYTPDKVVGDFNWMMRVNAGQGPVPYPLFIDIKKEGISKDSIITSRLRDVQYAEGGYIKLKSGSPYKLQPLLQTTKDSGTISAAILSYMRPSDSAKEIKKDPEQYTLAALITGKFKTAFPNGPPKPADPKKDTSKDAAYDPANQIKVATKECTVLAVADVDFISDDNSVAKFRFGSQVVARPRNDNLSFILNAVESLGGSEDLISIRSKGKINRPFTKVEKLQKIAEEKWRSEEKRLSQKLTDLQKKLSELQSSRSSGSMLTLNSDQQNEIMKFRQEEAETRKARRLVRKNLREDIETLGNHLIAANMLIIPFGVSLFGFGVFFNRSKRMKKSRRKNNGK